MHYVRARKEAVREQLPPEELARRFWAKTQVRGPDDCWLWTGYQIEGYGSFGADYRNVLAHRYSWEMHKAPIEDGLWVLHRCDVRLCVNPRHLFLGTHDDNMSDMVGKQRQLYGRRHNMAKLDEAAVLAIRSDPRRQREIAADYGITQTCVSAIVTRARWKHI